MNSAFCAIARLSSPKINFAIALEIRIPDQLDEGSSAEAVRRGKLTRRAAFIQRERRELKRGTPEEAEEQEEEKGGWPPEGSRSILVIHSGMVYSLILCFLLLPHLPPASISWTRISRASRRGPGYE